MSRVIRTSMSAFASPGDTGRWTGAGDDSEPGDTGRWTGANATTCATRLTSPSRGSTPGSRHPRARSSRGRARTAPASRRSALRCERETAVDQNLRHAGRVLVRLLEGRVVLDGLRVEDHDVGEVARLEQAAVGDARGCSAGSPLRRRMASSSGMRFLVAHVAGRAGARSCRRRAGAGSTCRNTPSGAIDAASEPKLTQGSAICRRTLSSDMRK